MISIPAFILAIAAIVPLTLIIIAWSLRVAIEQLARGGWTAATVWYRVAGLAIDADRQRGKAALWLEQSETNIDQNRRFYYFYPEEQDGSTALTDQNDPRGADSRVVE